MRDTSWYALFSENASDPVVEPFGIQVRPFCIERSRVFLMALGVHCLVYNVLWITIKTEDVVKHVLVLCACRFCRAFIFDAFPLIANEVDLCFLG